MRCTPLASSADARVSPAKPCVLAAVEGEVHRLVAVDAAAVGGAQALVHEVPCRSGRGSPTL